MRNEGDQPDAAIRARPASIDCLTSSLRSLGFLPVGSIAFRARYWIVPSGLRRSSWFSSQPVFGSSSTDPAPLMTGRPSALTVFVPLNADEVFLLSQVGEES